MGLSLLESIVYGIISGFSEFLPICPDSHRALFLHVIGETDDSAIRLSVHLGAFIALLTLCTPFIAKLNRERKIASVNHKRRKRQPDMRSLMDIKLTKSAVIPLMVCMVFYPFVSGFSHRLWVLAILLFLNGCALYFPQFYPRANKDGLTLTSADGVILGLGAGAGVMPGISRIGAALSAASLRGADRRYIMDIIFLLCLPAVGILLVYDLFAVLAGGATIAFLSLLCYIVAALTSFLGAYFSICMMRFFAVRAGFTAFAYYSWGLALLSFILYLTIS